MKKDIDPIEIFAKNLKAQIVQHVIENMKVNDIDLLENFKLTYQEMMLMTKEIQYTFRSFEKKMNKIVNSPSLYEDVYKMRDELIEIKKLLEKHGK